MEDVGDILFRPKPETLNPKPPQTLQWPFWEEDFRSGTIAVQGLGFGVLVSFWAENEARNPFRCLGFRVEGC